MRHLKSLIAVGALAALAPASSAQVLMQMLSFGPSTPNFDQTLTFDKFAVDPAHILSIKVSLELNIEDGILQVDNDGVDGATVDVELGASAALSSMDVRLLNAGFGAVAEEVALSTTATFNLAPNDGDNDQQFDADGGPDFAELNGGMQSGMSMGFVNPDFFIDYAGMGTFDILVDVNQVLDFGSAGGVSGAFTPVQADGKVKIEVTLIPAPASVAMLGLGGLVMARRRR